MATRIRIANLPEWVDVQAYLKAQGYTMANRGRTLRGVEAEFIINETLDDTTKTRLQTAVDALISKSLVEDYTEE